MSLQPLYHKIRGIVGTLFGFEDGNAAQLRSVSTNVLEVRSNDDLAYGIMRGAAPVGGNDYANKTYVDASSGGAAGALCVTKFAFDYVSGGVAATPIPSNADVYRVMLQINTAFDGAYTQISVGRNGNESLLMQAGDNAPGTPDIYVVDQITGIGATAGILLVTVSNPNSGRQTGHAANKLVDSLALFQTNGVQVGDQVVNLAARSEGWQTGYAANKLIDSTALFQTNGVQPGSRITNRVTNVAANVVSVDSETQLTLDADIFANYVLRASGSNTSVTANYLVDSGADFITSGVVNGDIVLNTANNTISSVISVDIDELELSDDIFLASPVGYQVFYGENYEVFSTANVVSVDSETQLTLDADIFANYVLRATGNNTSATANYLVDSGADFITSGVVNGDIVLNTADNTISSVIAVDIDELELSDDIFLGSPVGYRVFYGERYEISANSQGDGICAVMYSVPNS